MLSLSRLRKQRSSFHFVRKPFYASAEENLQAVGKHFINSPIISYFSHVFSECFRRKGNPSKVIFILDDVH